MNSFSIDLYPWKPYQLQQLLVRLCYIIAQYVLGL